MEDLKKIVEDVIEKIGNKNKKYDIQELEKFCSPLAIPKEFKSLENISELEDELKAFTIGCELFKEIVGHEYNSDDLETISEIKEAGVYQFLQATLQNEVTSIISDEYYLEKLLKLYSKDIENFDRTLISNGLKKIDEYSTVGLVRDINQDSLRTFNSKEITLLIVADGVGGGEHGEIASKIACDVSLMSLENQKYNDKTESQIEDLLKKAILNANNAVINYANKESIDTIGTTLSIALIYNRKLFVGHVGDSRIYRIYENKKLESITEDHSLPEVLFRSGEIATEEEKKNYKKNILVYVIGKIDLKEENLNVFCADKELTSDTLFLCSDGVWDIKGVEDKFDGDVKELKRYILDSIPTDNATFIRCKFDYKVEEIASNISQQEENIEKNIEPKIPDNWNLNKDKDIPKKSDKIDLIIEEEKDNVTSIIKEKNNSSENKILLSLIGVLVLGIGYLLYSDDNNTTTTVATNNTTAPVAIKNNDINKTTPNLVTKNTSVNNTPTPPKEKIAEPVATTIEKEIPVSQEEPSSKVNYTYTQHTPHKRDIPKKTQPHKRLTKNQSAKTTHRTKKHKNIENPKIETIKIKISKNNIKNDLLIFNKAKIWFGEKDIKTTKECYFKENIIQNKNKFICKLKMDVSNPDIVNQLTKIKFGKVEIGRHKTETHIVVTINDNYKLKKRNRIENQEYTEEIIFTEKNNVNNIKKEKEFPTQENEDKKKVINKQEVKHWSDSDGLFLSNNFILTFKKDRITLNNGSCTTRGIKLVCVIPHKKIKEFKDITSKVIHQEFAEEIVLNIDGSNNNVRVVITLKEGYRVVKKEKNGKKVFVFIKK